MRALTLHEPWASAVAHGVKTVETRSWWTRFRGPLAVHAAKRKPRSGEAPGEIIDNMLGRPTLFLPEPIPEEGDGDLCGFELWPGHVVATCNLVDVVPMVGRPPFEGVWPPEKRILTWDFDGRMLLVGGDQPRVDLPAHEATWGDYREGRYAWVLEDAKWIEPKPASGGRGLWEWDAA